jgi:hypothetical protein
VNFCAPLAAALFAADSGRQAGADTRRYVPPPATLPSEAEAVRSRHSLEAHAHKHGWLAGAEVIVRALQNDPARQRLITEQYGILVPETELKWRAHC